MNGELEKTNPEMVRENPHIHAAVIDSLFQQLTEARSRVDRLLAELGEERLLNGVLHTERDLLRDAGDRLLIDAVDSGCRCRRAWVCHRCMAIEGWKQVRGE